MTADPIPHVTPYDAAKPAQSMPWGHITWLVTGESPAVTSLTVGRVLINPGMANPRHRHNRCDEVLHLLRGRLVHTLGAARIEMVAGDSIEVPRGIFHNAENPGTEPAEMVVIFSSGDRDFEKEEI